MDEFKTLESKIQAFADKRDWGRFHNPKNLAMALAGETGELIAEFQWLTAAQSERSSLSVEKLKAIELEIADVAIYLIHLAATLEIDVFKAVLCKMEINESRF